MELKKPVSQRKLDANRANARKSTGPKSEQGKRAVRFNALDHGLYATSKAALLPIDDPRIYHALHCEWHRLYTPRDFEELTLLDDFVATHWRYVRQLYIETGIFRAELRLQDTLRAGGNLLQPDPADPRACVTYAFRGVSSFEVCSRHIGRLERSWMKKLDMLKKLHKRPDSEIRVPLSEELRQPPPLLKVSKDPPPPAQPQQPSKNEGTKPPQTPKPRGLPIIRVFDEFMCGRKPREDDASEPGNPPPSEPPTRK